MVHETVEVVNFVFSAVFLIWYKPLQPFSVPKKNNNNIYLISSQKKKPLNSSIVDCDHYLFQMAWMFWLLFFVAIVWSILKKMIVRFGWELKKCVRILQESKVGWNFQSKMLSTSPFVIWHINKRIIQLKERVHINGYCLPMTMEYSWQLENSKRVWIFNKWW